MSDARDNLAAVVEKARREHAPVYLSRHGRRIAAVIDAEDLDHLIELAEELVDVRESDAAMSEMSQPGAEWVSWEDVKADLGL